MEENTKVSDKLWNRNVGRQIKRWIETKDISLGWKRPLGPVPDVDDFYNLSKFQKVYQN
jgi:hypothetical protein